jgi:hypothetical protein
MMHKIVSKFVRFSLILAVTFSSYGNVLCYGSDGHVAIEPLFHNHCGHDEHEHDENQGRDSVCLNSCSPCQDVLIRNDLEPARMKNSVSFCNFHFSNSVSKEITSCFAIRIAQYEISSFFAPLNSIRLLT